MAAEPKLLSKALHTWDAAAGGAVGDLFFAAGEMIEVVEPNQPGQGWVTGRNARGEVGVLPRNYVELISTVVVEQPDRTASGAFSDVGLHEAWRSATSPNVAPSVGSSARANLD